MIYPFNAYEVFKMAIKIEKNGYNFYNEAAQKPYPEEIKSLFSFLAQEELKHIEKFEEIKNQLPNQLKVDTVWDPDNEIDQYLKLMADAHVFILEADKISQKLNSFDNFLDAIKMAKSFEKDSIIFFLEMMTASNGHESQKQIKKLVEEEQAHLRKLTLIWNENKNK